MQKRKLNREKVLAVALAASAIWTIAKLTVRGVRLWGRMPLSMLLLTLGLNALIGCTREQYLEACDENETWAEMFNGEYWCEVQEYVEAAEDGDYSQYCVDCAECWDEDPVGIGTLGLTACHYVDGEPGFFPTGATSEERWDFLVATCPAQMDGCPTPDFYEEPTGDDDTSEEGCISTCSDDIDDDGYSEDQGDCDDTDPSRSPGRSEDCDGRDNDCSGEPDPDEVDLDYDGFMGCDDCNDLDPEINPDQHAEALGAFEFYSDCGDGIDNDCDGMIDDGCDAYFQCVNSLAGRMNWNCWETTTLSYIDLNLRSPAVAPATKTKLRGFILWVRDFAARMRASGA